ncbi:hypothetical protein E2C06_30425 [Dankookia rubra]|uniref:Uncharacterized protein n=1 Tax=Dankookia rubra TaxID=1442381 RepID=A0A4R5Q7I4_9PROT|nr:hypothetical protein [Dankookia rubra]TDH58860.1 hypothetical protein E2C06_30425 [Dankookia rubra]
MALSDTARRILTEATRHSLRLAAPADKLPTAATRGKRPVTRRSTVRLPRRLRRLAGSMAEARRHG